MTKIELLEFFSDLGLTQAEAARLLSVDSRTVRRWVEDATEISGPAEVALKAWRSLHRYGLPWHPDGQDVLMQQPEQIAIARAASMDLASLLNKVNERGGPAAPWMVDLKAGRATLNSIQVSFYRLPNGGFSPQSYCRSGDSVPDLRRDWTLIEDAFACIANAIAASHVQR